MMATGHAAAPQTASSPAAPSSSFDQSHAVPMHTHIRLANPSALDSQFGMNVSALGRVTGEQRTGFVFSARLLEEQVVCIAPIVTSADRRGEHFVAFHPEATQSFLNYHGAEVTSNLWDKAHKDGSTMLTERCTATLEFAPGATVTDRRAALDSANAMLRDLRKMSATAFNLASTLCAARVTANPDPTEPLDFSRIAMQALVRRDQRHVGLQHVGAHMSHLVTSAVALFAAEQAATAWSTLKRSPTTNHVAIPLVDGMDQTKYFRLGSAHRRKHHCARVVQNDAGQWTLRIVNASNHHNREPVLLSFVLDSTGQAMANAAVARGEDMLEFGPLVRGRAQRLELLVPREVRVQALKDAQALKDDKLLANAGPGQEAEEWLEVDNDQLAEYTIGRGAAIDMGARDFAHIAFTNGVCVRIGVRTASVTEAFHRRLDALAAEEAEVRRVLAALHPNGVGKGMAHKHLGVDRVTFGRLRDHHHRRLRHIGIEQRDIRRQIASLVSTLHRTVLQFVRDNARFVVVGRFNTASMILSREGATRLNNAAATAPAATTTAAPAKASNLHPSVKRALLDLRVSQFVDKLVKGGTVVGMLVATIDESYTSKACAACGAFNDVGSRKEYHCTHCGAMLDRDANGALNIWRKWVGDLHLHGQRAPIRVWIPRHFVVQCAGASSESIRYRST